MSTDEKNTIDRSYPAKKSGKVRIIVVLAFVAILAVSATAATKIYSAYRLPDPATADIDGLLRWLVTVDLAEHPEDIHRTLARRLEEEFNDSMDYDKLKSQLNDEYRTQLWSNIQILLRSWFFEKMNCYYAASPSEQTKIIDQLLDQTEAWQWVIELAPTGKFNTEKPATYLVFFMHEIEQWKQTGSHKKAERLSQFVTAIQTRWFFRQFF